MVETPELSAQTLGLGGELNPHNDIDDTMMNGMELQSTGS